MHPTSCARSARTRLLALGATGLAVALVAAGCGTGSSPSPQGPAVTPAATSATEGGPSETPAASPSPSVSSTPDGGTAPTSDATAPTPTTGSTPGPTSEATSGTGGGTSSGTGDAKGPKIASKPKSTEHADLRVGDHGARVTKLQQQLRDAGYWLPKVDGAFGPSTLQAVWALQKAAGLQRDGVVGTKTQQALDHGLRPHARTHHGHVIEVDLSKQLVLIVDDGHVGTILNASSGSGKPFKDKSGHQYVAHTPTGTYRMGRQYDGMYTSNLGLGEMWRPKFFNGGIALHGLGFDVPPYPASHGCVRISNPAMDWVWSANKAPQGTVVTVYR